MMKSQIWIEKKLEPQTEKGNIYYQITKKKRKKRKQEKINEDPIYK